MISRENVWPEQKDKKCWNGTALCWTAKLVFFSEISKFWTDVLLLSIFFSQDRSMFSHVQLLSADLNYPEKMHTTKKLKSISLKLGRLWVKNDKTKHAENMVRQLCWNAKQVLI